MKKSLIFLAIAFIFLAVPIYAAARLIVPDWLRGQISASLPEGSSLTIKNIKSNADLSFVYEKVSFSYMGSELNLSEVHFKPRPSLSEPLILESPVVTLTRGNQVIVFKEITVTIIPSNIYLEKLKLKGSVAELDSPESVLLTNMEFVISEIAKKDFKFSIHADAVDDRRARGASVYALSLKGASDEAAKRLAERENASSLVGGVSLADKDPVLASVLLDLSQNAALSASLEIGSDVIGQLAGIGKVHRNTVQQAGFLVLKSPDIPSILVETAYISNPDEERLLRSRTHQDKLAKAILAGVRNYFYENPPPNTLIAMNQRRNPTQPVSHVITRGDTLSEIAERYNVSMSAIRTTNRLSSDIMRIGQTLKIPVYAGT